MPTSKKTKTEIDPDFAFLNDFQFCDSGAHTLVAKLTVVGNADSPAAFELFDPALVEHTADHVNCPACRAANAALQAENLNLSSLPFSHAAKIWKLRRAQSTALRDRTQQITADYFKQLDKFFGKLCLRDITPGHIRGYQMARVNNLLRVAGQDTKPWKNKAGNSLVNHELSALAQLLQHCRLWARIKPYYFPLPVKNWSPREVLSEEDEEVFFNKAAQHPEAQLAYWVAAITNNTTASGCELRGLRLKHLFLRPEPEISEIYIPEDSVKNSSRPRKIALNPTARWAIAQCYKRALKLGCSEPDDYLFPGRPFRNHYDPKRLASRSWLRKSWEKLRSATGFPNIKPHDLRFLAITRMLENDVDPETVKSIAGHVTHKMLEYYAQHRRRVKYAAVMAIDSTAKKKLPVLADQKRQRRQTG